MNDAEVDAMSQRYNSAMDAQRKEIDSYRQSDMIIREENVKLRADVANLNIQIDEMRSRFTKIAGLLLPPHADKRPDIIALAWALADFMKTEKRNDDCPACNGRGFLQYLADGEKTTCALCDGKKKV